MFAFCSAFQEISFFGVGGALNTPPPQLISVWHAPWSRLRLLVALQRSEVHGARSSQPDSARGGSACSYFPGADRLRFGLPASLGLILSPARLSFLRKLPPDTPKLDSSSSVLFASSDVFASVWKGKLI